MKSLLFLDDERNFNDVTWIDYPQYKNVYVFRRMCDFMFAIINLEESLSKFDFSFDHDLQDFSLGEAHEKTGYDCVKWLCDYVSEESIDISKCNFFYHTKNPIGQKNMQTYLENFLNFQKRFLNENT